MCVRAAKNDMAQFGADHPGVLDLRRDEGGEARLLHGDAARVDDLRIRPRRLIEHHPSGQEVLIGDAGGRHDDALRIDLGALGEQDA